VLLRALPLLLVAFPALAEPVTYKLDPQKSWVYVVVYNEHALGPIGHDHGVRAMDFTGTVVWDALDPTKCKVDITIPVQNLYADPPGMREREKLPMDEAVDDSAKTKIRANFLSRNQLDAENYPTITYSASSCTGSIGNVTVSGNLTIHGTTKPITTNMIVTPTPALFTARRLFKARATEFGFKPYSNLGGLLLNKDEMKFVVDVVGIPAP